MYSGYLNRFEEQDKPNPVKKSAFHCYGPATIAAAVYEGHRYAQELNSDIDPDGVPFKTIKYDLELGG
ncbi:MAG: hypothetical protein ACPG51_16960 [Thiolinea sp.]